MPRLRRQFSSVLRLYRQAVNGIVYYDMGDSRKLHSSTIRVLEQATWRKGLALGTLRVWFWRSVESA